MPPRRATVSVFLLLGLAACGNRAVGSHGASGGVAGGGGTGGSQAQTDGAVGPDLDAAAGGGAPGRAGSGAPGTGGNTSSGGSAGDPRTGLAGNGSGPGGIAGNVSSGGGGGSGDPDPGTSLLLPAGCEARARTETADTCTLSAFCDSLPQVTSCQRLESGRWRCGSGPRHTDRLYEIDGVAGLQACAVATGLNSKDDLRLGADGCEPTLEWSGDGSCKTDLVCGRAIDVDFAPGVSARLARYGEVECAQGTSPSGISCYFSFSVTTSGFDLTTESGSLACRPLLEFCMGATAPDFNGPRSCVVAKATTTADGCERSDLCSNPQPPPPKGFTRVGGRYASCQKDTGGGASCSCSRGDSNFQFHTALTPSDATCAGVITSCEDTAEIKATGDATCQPVSQTSNRDACEADLSCRQPATVDGREVVADGRLLVKCARQKAGDPWSCSCASDQRTATFSVGAAAGTSAQACRQAPDECLKHIPVRLGPYGSVVSPPDPVF